MTIRTQYIPRSVSLTNSVDNQTIEYTSSKLQWANKMLQQHLKNQRNILTLQQNASLSPDNPTQIIADIFSDANGFGNTIDTTSTTATYDSASSLYKCVDTSQSFLVDDFNDGDYSGWTAVGSGWSASNYYLSHDSSGASGNQCIYHSISVSNQIPLDIVVDTRTSRFDTANGQVIWQLYNAGTRKYYLQWNANDYKFYLKNSSDTTMAVTSAFSSTNTWYTTEVKRYLNGTWEVFVDGTSEATASADTTSQDFDEFRIGSNWGLGQAQAICDFDNVSFTGGGGGLTAGDVITNNLVTESGGITSVFVTYDATLPTDTSIVSYVSTDGGTSWQEVTANEKTSVTSGTTLKAKFTLNPSTTSTPALYNYAIAYWL